MLKTWRTSARLVNFEALTAASRPAVCRGLVSYQQASRIPTNSPANKLLVLQTRSLSSSPTDDIDFSKYGRPRANDPFKWIASRVQIAFHMFMIDKQFAYKEFSEGAFQAVLLVSDLISKGRVNELESLLHPKIFQSVKKSIESRKDRRETLNLIQNRTDVSQQVPAGFKVQKNGNRTIVDIECVFYILPNAQQMFQEMFSQNKTGYRDIGQLVNEKAQMAHYVFRREYGPDVTSTDWMIIYLKHYAVKDLE